MNSSEACLTEEERAHVIGLLNESASEFLELIADLDDDQWIRKAAATCWSVQQTAEHLVLGERAMLAKITAALAGPANTDWEEEHARKTKFLGRVITDRSQKATAPAALDPHHHWTRGQTVTRYKAGRARTLQFAKEMAEPLKAHAAEHPFAVFNLLNTYHWLLYIPLHNARHNQQIAQALQAGHALAENALKETAR